MIDLEQLVGRLPTKRHNPTGALPSSLQDKSSNPMSSGHCRGEEQTCRPIQCMATFKSMASLAALNLLSAPAATQPSPARLRSPGRPSAPVCQLAWSAQTAWRRSWRHPDSSAHAPQWQAAGSAARRNWLFRGRRPQKINAGSGHCELAGKPGCSDEGVHGANAGSKACPTTIVNAPLPGQQVVRPGPQAVTGSLLQAVSSWQSRHISAWRWQWQAVAFCSQDRSTSEQSGDTETSKMLLGTTVLGSWHVYRLQGPVGSAAAVFNRVEILAVRAF